MKKESLIAIVEHLLNKLKEEQVQLVKVGGSISAETQEDSVVSLDDANWANFSRTGKINFDMKIELFDPLLNGN